MAAKIMGRTGKGKKQLSKGLDVISLLMTKEAGKQGLALQTVIVAFIC